MLNELVQLGLELQGWFEGNAWDFCFIGGLAHQHWGEPRFTKDVDLTLLTGFGDEEKYIDWLLSKYVPRTEGMREFALANRVLLMQTSAGVPFDVSLGGLPYEEEMIRRSQKIEYAHQKELRICSAEDLVVLKSFANRDLDWHDVKTILIRQQGKLDWGYIEKQLPPLCALKEQPELVDRLMKLRERYP